MKKKTDLADFWPDPKLGEVARHVAGLLKAEREQERDRCAGILSGWIKVQEKSQETIYGLSVAEIDLATLLKTIKQELLNPKS